MFRLADFPLLLFLVSLALLWTAAWLGVNRFKRIRSQVAAQHEDFRVIQGATLTLLGLIIAFTFSMAVGRYDQRKNYEADEANAIGTEYVRADLLPAADAAKVKALLIAYLDQRILFYMTRWADDLAMVNERTTKLRGELWAAVLGPTSVQRNPVSAIVVSGMNDVFNRQGYTQASWWNRIPVSAWALMAAIALCSVALVGIGAREAKGLSGILLTLPIVISIAFFLIADLDCPRGGIIRLSPQNLQVLAQSLRAV
jgi:hypothetical protein